MQQASLQAQDSGNYTMQLVISEQTSSSNFKYMNAQVKVTQKQNECLYKCNNKEVKSRDSSTDIQWKMHKTAAPKSRVNT